MSEKNYESIIERIIKHNQDDLNEWELKFMNDVSKKVLEDKINLSPKQKEKVLDINSKVLGRTK